MTKIALFSTSSRTIETAKVLKDNFKLDLIVTKTDKIVGETKILNQMKLKSLRLKIQLIL